VNSLTIQKNIQDDTQVQVFDNFGLLVFDGHLNGNPGESLQVNMSTVPLGIYVVRCITKDGVQMYTVKKE
jgi:hypothetical protein